MLGHQMLILAMGSLTFHMPLPRFTPPSNDVSSHFTIELFLSTSLPIIPSLEPYKKIEKQVHNLLTRETIQYRCIVNLSR